MYKILFTSATSLELKKIKDIIKKDKHKAKIDFLNFWIWNYKTILNLTKHLKDHSYDFIVNIWICGYKKEKNPIQVARIYNLSNKKELLIPINFRFLKLDSIACSDEIVYDEKYLLDEKYVDMESYWFELVLDDFEIPRIILKIPFDKIWSKKTKNYDKKEIEKLMEKINYKKLIEEIIIFLDKYKSKETDFSKYFDYYKLSFSEKIIFKKNYFKYETLTWKSFNKFFIENNDLWKKEFIKKLESIKIL